MKLDSTQTSAENFPKSPPHTPILISNGDVSMTVSCLPESTVTKSSSSFIRLGSIQSVPGSRNQLPKVTTTNQRRCVCGSRVCQTLLSQSRLLHQHTDCLSLAVTSQRRDLPKITTANDLYSAVILSCQ
ncbi:hypothetical protein BaRGS_00020669 [Batillaria attramentaria]|uniref:Post-SET domain-containing protein n=1 Tax=Batillaria attramentaria TaxID=370345 RepID=A0ABD0KLG4_9CAEN